MTEFSVFYQRNRDPHTVPLCLIQTPKQILSLHLHRILFIESRQKHSIIHLKDSTLTLSIPLYRFLQELPADTFLQTHRSFLVNLENISYIDKSAEPWTISFIGTEKNAYISRSFRHQVMQLLSLSD